MFTSSGSRPAQYLLEGQSSCLLATLDHSVESRDLREGGGFLSPFFITHKTFCAFKSSFTGTEGGKKLKFFPLL